MNQHSPLRQILAVCVGALALTVATPALAAASHGVQGHTAAKKHGKKKRKRHKKSRVKVRCARTITCRTRPGPTGPAGAPGAKGAPGTSSGGIAARPRGGSMTSTACTSPTPSACGAGASAYPLNPASWTQSAGQWNELTGQLNVTLPPHGSGPGQCDSGGGFTTLTVQLSLDGTVISTDSFTNAGPASVTFANGISFQPTGSSFPFTAGTGAWDIPAPAGPTGHTLAAQIWDDCTGASADNTHPTVNQYAIDVLAFS